MRKATRCLLFPTGTGSPDHIWTRAKEVISRGSQIYEQDLDLDELFPNGSLSFRLEAVPGSGFPLPNDFRIYVSRVSALAPINKCIQKQFGHEWRGNVLLAKYGRGYKDGLIQVQLFEASAIKILAGLCVTSSMCVVLNTLTCWVLFRWIEEFNGGEKL